MSDMNNSYEEEHINIEAGERKLQDSILSFVTYMRDTEEEEEEERNLYPSQLKLALFT